MANNKLTGSSGNSSYTYNINARVGNYSKGGGSTTPVTQSDLNNRLSGTDANAIYQATHQGSLGDPSYTPSPKTETDTDKKKPKGGTTTGGTTTSSSSIDASAYGGYSGGGGNDYVSMINEMLARQQAAAQAAYDQSKANLDAAYANTYSSLKNNLGLTLDRLDSQYKFNEGKAQADADKSLREAYINYMMNKKNLNQGLSALGMSGGATESSMAKLFNNYGNSRNNINTTLADNLAMLLNELSNNKSQAQQLYNQQDAEAQLNYASQINALNSALMNSQISSYSGSNLSNLASYAAALNSLNNTYDIAPTKNSLAVNQISTTQGNDMGSVTDYAKWKAMADNIANSGGDVNEVIYQLRNRGINNDMLYKVLGV